MFYFFNFLVIKNFTEGKYPILTRYISRVLVDPDGLNNST